MSTQAVHSVDESRSVTTSSTFAGTGRTPSVQSVDHLDALITGASGFIGRHLARRLLSEGQRVGLLVRRQSSVEELERRGAKVFPADLFDVHGMAKLVRGTQVVYHLAAMTSAFSRMQLMAVNGSGARNVALACAMQETPPRLVYVSSVAAAGPVARGQMRREEDRPAPVSNYGTSKLAGELAVAELAQLVPITIVRPGIVFGPENVEMLPMFQVIRRLSIHPVVGWRSPPLSMSYIDDTVEIIRRATQIGSVLSYRDADPLNRLTGTSGVYFACAREYPDYAQLGKMIGKYVRRPWAPAVPLLGPVPWIAAAINQAIAYCRGRPDSFNIDKIREARVASWACSCHRAESDLNYRACRTLSDNLAITVDWYRQQRWL